MENILEKLNWRYAVKKFDAEKKVSAEDLNTIKEAVRLSVSSYGLQPYKVLLIENPEIREKLRAAAYGQPQVSDASQLFVFAIEKDVDENAIDAYIQRISTARNIPAENLQGFSDVMKQTITSLPAADRNNWSAKQAYIALGFLINAAASLHVDATPMEGFDPTAFNEILGLDQLGLSAVVIAAIGYRHDEDAAQHQKKVRKSHEELFITI